MSLAKELGDAKKSGDQASIMKAKIAHDNYKEICLQADEMFVGYIRELI